jgi:hypothetical protein
MLYTINILIISLLVAVITLWVDYLMNTTIRFVYVAIIGIFCVILCTEIIQISQYYSISDIVSVFYDFLQVPLILFAGFCYIISWAIYIVRVFLMKKNNKEFSKKASPEEIDQLP